MNNRKLLATKAAIYEMGLRFNQQPSPERIEAYAKDLAEEYTPEQITFAFRQVIASGSAFFPSLAEILNHLKPMAPKSEDRAAELMEEIVRLCIEHGYNRLDRIERDLSKDAKTVLGEDKHTLLRICRSYENELPTIKAQLRNVFRARLESQKANQHNGKLVQLGIVNQDQIEEMRRMNFSGDIA